MSDQPLEFQADLDELLTALLDGQLNRGQRRRLNELLSHHAPARQQYIAAMGMHAKLHARYAATNNAGDEDFASKYEAVDPSTPSDVHLATRLVRHAVNFLVRPTPLSLVVAAAVVLGTLGVLAAVSVPIYNAVRGTGNVNSPDSGQAHVATLANTHNAQWAPGQLGLSRHQRLASGQRLDLASGLVELAYATGETVVIEGPASFVVGRHPQHKSCGWGHLEAGRITASVPPPAVGFTIETPSASIVDLGTNFGVSVWEEATEVHVFSGTVEARVRTNDPAEMHVISIGRGEAFRMVAGRIGAERIALAEDLFTRRLPANDDPGDAYAAAVLASDPVAYWRLNEHVGTTAFDISNSRHGEYRGGTSLSASSRPGGAPARCPAFDGSDDYVDVKHAMRLNPESFTLEAWVRLVQAPRDYASVVTSRMTGEELMGYMIYVSPQGNYEFWTGGGEAWDQLQGETARVGQWTHIAATFQKVRALDRDTFVGVKRLYLDGRLVAEDAQAMYVPQVEFTLPLRIAAGRTEESQPQYYFPGQLADVAVYERALTAAEIARHCDAAAE